MSTNSDQTTLPQSPSSISAKSASIDALIDRIHSLVRQMYELGQSASSHVQGIASRGDLTVDRFDSNFGAITTDVERIYGSANHRVEQMPVGMLIVLGCALGILLVLGLAWMASILAGRVLMRGGGRGNVKDEDI